MKENSSPPKADWEARSWRVPTIEECREFCRAADKWLRKRGLPTRVDWANERDQWFREHAQRKRNQAEIDR